ncbi:hypothetical protein G9A89_001388 [Geosiphon pyriformis]|nr:hypothetical protein G9A89_001388 [Geosiphon pyriformis]
MINWINEIHIPLKINQTKKRSPPQSRIKRRMLPDDEGLLISSDVAFIVNAFDCLDLNNIGSKVPGLQIKVDARYYFISPYNSILLIMFAGPKLTKEQWASKNSRQVPLRFTDALKFDERARVDSQLLKDVNLLFPTLSETIKSFLSQFPKVNSILFVGHGLGGAYASIAAIRWSIERFEIIKNNLWPNINLSATGEGIFTYGAPRIGNRYLSDAFNLEIVHRRFTHGNDHVPHFPSSSMGWKHFGTEIWIDPLSNCDCPDDPNTYWNCNFITLSINERELWVKSQYSEENLECNAGQSISEVPGKLFHSGPYFGVEMGNCEAIHKLENLEDSLRNFQNRANN